MTEATAAVDETVFVPRGRPVLRFVTALVLLIAALVVVWDTGLFNPRLELELESFQHVSPGQAVVHVRNEGRVEARVRVVELDSRFVRLAAPSEEVRLRGGRSGRLLVRYLVDCAGYEAATGVGPPGPVPTPDAIAPSGPFVTSGGMGPTLRLVVRARGPIGPDRERRWPRRDELTLAPICGER